MNTNNNLIYAYATHCNINGLQTVTKRYVNMPNWEYRTLNPIVIDHSKFARTESGNIYVDGNYATTMNYFLFECDELYTDDGWKKIETEEEKIMALNQQAQAIRAIPQEFKNCIYTIIYSGSKSFHIILRTNWDEISNQSNKLIYKRIHAELTKRMFGKSKYKVDESVAEPHRLTRNGNVQNVKTCKIQSIQYFNDNAKAYDVKQLVATMKKEQQEAEYFKSKRQERMRKKMDNGNIKSDYHNLPAVKAVQMCSEGNRDTTLSRALYAMKKNGYGDYCSEFIDEARCYIGEEIYRKFINDTRYK